MGDKETDYLVNQSSGDGRKLNGEHILAIFSLHV